jgi:hypothetical protein
MPIKAVPVQVDRFRVKPGGDLGKESPQGKCCELGKTVENRRTEQNAKSNKKNSKENTNIENTIDRAKQTRRLRLAKNESGENDA